MDVRPATPADADSLAAVIAVVADEGRWLLTEGPIDPSERAQRIRPGLAQGRDLAWVLVDGSEVVGTLGLHPTGAAGVYSLGMCLLEQVRGHGGGGRLLEAALAGARERGIHKVELEVFPDNAAAIALYASRGFAVEGLRRDHYLRKDGSRRSALIMSTFP